VTESAKQLIKDLCRTLGHSFPDNTSCERCGLQVPYVFVNGLLQCPGEDYTLIGGNMVKFMHAPPMGSDIVVSVYVNGMIYRSNFSNTNGSDHFSFQHPTYS